MFGLVFVVFPSVFACVTVVAWHDGLRGWVITFPNVSAWLGLLVPGCLFSSHVSNSSDFQSGWGHFFELKAVIWHAWCLHFGTLGNHFGTFGAP